MRHKSDVCRIMASKKRAVSCRQQAKTYSLYSKYIESCEAFLTTRVLARQLEMVLPLREDHVLYKVRTSRAVYLEGLAIGTKGMKRK